MPGKEIGIHAFDFLGSSIRMYPNGDAGSLEKKIAECVKKYEAKSITICEYCGADNADVCNEPPVFKWVTALCPLCKEKELLSIIGNWTNELTTRKKFRNKRKNVISKSSTMRIKACKGRLAGICSDAYGKKTKEDRK